MCVYILLVKERVEPCTSDMLLKESNVSVIMKVV